MCVCVCVCVCARARARACVTSGYAFALAQNNKWELDGRGPNGYAGCAWCFGHADNAFPDRPIYGWESVLFLLTLRARKLFGARSCALSVSLYLSVQSCPRLHRSTRARTHTHSHTNTHTHTHTHHWHTNTHTHTHHWQPCAHNDSRGPGEEVWQGCHRAVCQACQRSSSRGPAYIARAGARMHTPTTPTHRVSTMC